MLVHAMNAKYRRASGLLRHWHSCGEKNSRWLRHPDWNTSSQELFFGTSAVPFAKTSPAVVITRLRVTGSGANFRFRLHWDKRPSPWLVVGRLLKLLNIKTPSPSISEKAMPRSSNGSRERLSEFEGKELS